MEHGVLTVDLSQYLTGGAAGRPDSLSGLNPQFQSALASMFAAAPGGLQIKSAYRSPELQAQLWEQALAKYGSPEAARKWVAPPGRSQHGHGNAVDLGYMSDDAKAWAHANASQYGLAFPLGNEDWHIELASARGGAPTTPVSSSPMAPQAMDMMTGGGAMPTGPTPAGTGAEPNGMLMGNLAAMFMQQQQARQQAQKEEQDAEEARRAALFGGGVAGLYA